MTSPTDTPETPPPPPAEPIWLTVDEAAARIRVDARSIYRKVETGELATHRLGKGPKAPLRFRAEDVDALLIPTRTVEDA